MEEKENNWAHFTNILPYDNTSDLGMIMPPFTDAEKSSNLPGCQVSES